MFLICPIQVNDRYTDYLYRFKKLFFLVVLFPILSYSQVQTPFTPRLNESLRGNFTTIGNNTVSRYRTSNYNGSSNNTAFALQYVDIDNDNSTFNSSSANLSNLDNTANCVVLFKAYLYWAAADKEPDEDDLDSENQPNWNFNDVKLMLPGEIDYTTVTADDVIFRGRDINNHFVNDPYICVKDITNEVIALDNIFGRYQVANVEGKEGNLVSHGGGNTGASGGWQIVFVYESPNLPPRNITLFDGYAHVTRDVNDFDILFDGFQAVPTGEVSARVVFGALEGDRSIQGDRLQIQDVNNNFVDLQTQLRNANNFFNSRITIDNTNFLNRNPASTNTLGFDAAVFNLDNDNNSIIANSQTSATLRLTSDQETYGLYLLGLSVEVYQPNLGPMLIDIANGNNPANPGDVLGISLDIQNSGNDDAENVEISTIIPNQVSFIPPTNLPDGVTYTYDSVTRELTFFVENSYMEIGDPVIDLNFDIEVNDACYFLEDNCDLDYQLQFTSTYTGLLNGDTQNTVSTSDVNSCEDLPLIFSINQPEVNWETLPGALDVTLECNDTNGLADAQLLEPLPDNCSFTLNETIGDFVPDPDCPGGGTYTNTWNFTDACGVTIEDFVQIITITDTTPPTASNPAPITVQCIDDIPDPDILVVTDEADNCSNTTVAFVDDVSDGNNCSETITRTYSITDGCGNSITVTQDIIIDDTIAPTASNPDPLTLQCIADIPEPDISVVTDAADNCSVPAITFISDEFSTETCPQTVIRTYRLTDACDNTTDVTQTITINDDIPPTASNPSDLVLECTDPIPDIDLSVVSDAADNCSAPVVMHVSDVTDNMTCPQTIIRTFSVTDACNNSITVSQNIIFEDTIAPTVIGTFDEEITVSCLSIPEAPNLEFEDNCSINLTVIYNETNNNDNDTVDYDIIRDWVVTDECGNEATFTQIIHVEIADCDTTCGSCGGPEDTIPPTASNPADLQVSCTDAIPPPNPDVVIDEIDNCTIVPPTVALLSETVNSECTDRITRVYRVTDECGNFIDVSHTISIIDDVFPTASNPPDINVSCESDIPVSDVSQPTCTERILRTYSVTDQCGNAITVTQIINVVDDVLPTASNPAPISVQCIEDQTIYLVRKLLQEYIVLQMLVTIRLT